MVGLAKVGELIVLHASGDRHADEGAADRGPRQPPSRMSAVGGRTGGLELLRMRSAPMLYPWELAKRDADLPQPNAVLLGEPNAARTRTICQLGVCHECHRPRAPSRINDDIVAIRVGLAAPLGSSEWGQRAARPADCDQALRLTATICSDGCPLESGRDTPLERLPRGRCTRR